MPEQTYGGDDDKDNSKPQKEIKKLDLKKYASLPDANVRDIFLGIMENYSEKKPPARQEFVSLEQHKVPLFRIALSELGKKENYYSFSKTAIANYTLMLFLDAPWLDIFESFIIESYGIKYAASKPVVAALNKLYQDPSYKGIIDNCFVSSIRNTAGMSAILSYLSAMKNKEIIKKMKKELIIIAKNDVETNQYNAITSLSLIMEDDIEAKTVVVSLLAHWDEETRYLVALILKNITDPKIVDFAKRQASVESSERIKKILEKIINLENVMPKPHDSKTLSALKESIEELKKSSG